MQISMGSAFSPTGAMESCRTALAPFETGVKLDILSLLFSEVAKGFPMPDVPQDFLRLSMAAMHRLHTSGRSNTVYLLAKALGTMRADDSDSLLPVSRMPMGLLEYTIAFFAATSIQQVCIIVVINWRSYYILYCRFLVRKTIGSGCRHSMLCLVVK